MDQSKYGSIAVSLIIATVGRVDELNRMLTSISAQKLKNFELIIVDQNSDERVTAVLERWTHALRFTHVRSPRGLSRARNLGRSLASGVIVAFPDDDCWYPEDLLSQVKDWFERHLTHDLLCCKLEDGCGCEVASRWPRHSQAIDRGLALRACVSPSLFLRRTALERVGGFDEQMGLGAATPFQSGEDSDLALRCLKAGHKGWFEKRLSVFHPRKGPGDATAGRALEYGMGFGYLLRKHRYSPTALIYHVLRALGGAVKSLVTAQPDKAAFYLQSAHGRLRGYFYRLPKIPCIKSSPAESA
jgi:glycosyltransferase involved in cell wall biosynthesis